MRPKLAETVDMGGAVANFFSNYANFRGRSSRSEYWYIFLFSFLLSIPAYFISFLPSVELQGFVALIAVLAALSMVLPGISLFVRRLRDTELSPFLLFLVFIPVVGVLVLPFLMMFPSRNSLRSVATPVGRSSSRSILERELRSIDHLHKEGLIDAEQLKEAKNKALGI